MCESKNINNRMRVCRNGTSISDIMLQLQHLLVINKATKIHSQKEPMQTMTNHSSSTVIRARFLCNCKKLQHRCNWSQCISCKENTLPGGQWLERSTCRPIVCPRFLHPVTYWESWATDFCEVFRPLFLRHPFLPLSCG